MNEYQVDVERRTRRTIGGLVVCYGVIFLVISSLLLIAHREDEFHPVAQLVMIATTGLIGLVQLFRRHFVVGAIAQATLALTTGLVTVLCASAVVFQAHSCVALIGALLIGFGAFARINDVVEEKLVDVKEETVAIQPGRKYVYRNNKVVAIEEWSNGKLVTTTPFVPQIAGASR